MTMRELVKAYLDLPREAQVRFLDLINELDVEPRRERPTPTPQTKRPRPRKAKSKAKRKGGHVHVCEYKDGPKGEHRFLSRSSKARFCSLSCAAKANKPWRESAKARSAKVAS